MKVEEEEELQEAREQRQAEMSKQMEAKQAEEQLKKALREVLEEAAYNRMMNVASANRKFFFMAARPILMASKRMGRKLSERELIELLKAIKGQTEKETTITFHKK